MNGAVDRRTRRRLWLAELRWSYPFRWAHKPRCERFRRDVLRLGHVHLCRSCTCVYAGLIATLTVGLALGVQRYPSLWIWMLAAAGTTLLLSAPPWYKRLPRVVRDIARVGLGATGALVVLALLAGQWIAGLGMAALLFAFWRFYFRLRGPRKAKACDGCEELHRDAVCSGYAYQHERMLRFEEEAAAILLGSGFTPDLPADERHAESPGTSEIP